MIFAYRGINAEGKRVRSKIEAASLDEAKSKLKAQRILYESIHEDAPSFLDNLSLTRRYRISPKELSQLSRELAMYIRSGITIVNAIRIVQMHYEHHRKMSLFLKTVSTYLDEGKNFYSALDSQRIVILPEFFKQSIKVSESGGILDEVLIELSRFLKEQDRINKEVRGAFAYPAFMLGVSLLMVAFMLTFVVPQITGIFASMKQELPAITRFVVASGNFLNAHYVLLGALIAGSAALFYLLRRFNRTFLYLSDRFFLRVPILGTIALKSELGRFAYVGSLLVRSGVPFVQTINLAANILRNSVLKRLFSDAAEKVVEGKRLSSALHEASYKIDTAFVQAIALGEETSQLEPVLVNISELYFEENRDRIAMLLSLLEPALMLFVGGVIGFIVAAMLLPIFSMSIQ